MVTLMNARTTPPPVGSRRQIVTRCDCSSPAEPGFGLYLRCRHREASR